MATFNHPLPENIRKCLPIALRTNANTRTAIEEDEVGARKREKLLHHQFEAWLILNQIPYVHSRMDKKSTIREGWPDFSVFYRAKTVFVEFKKPGEDLKPKQSIVVKELRVMGFEVLVETDAGLAILWAKRALEVE